MEEGRDGDRDWEWEWEEGEGREEDGPPDTSLPGLNAEAKIPPLHTIYCKIVVLIQFEPDHSVAGGDAWLYNNAIFITRTMLNP